jgi:hypothetical protein
MNNFQEELYRQKYLKYKEKYLAAKQLAGNPIIESDLRPGEGQEIGLVTGVEHPYYNVTNNHGTFRVVLRAGVTHKIKKNGTQKEHKIEKNVTFVLIQPEVCDFGQEKCGDIVKIYSPKEKIYLLHNQTRLIEKGFITERLYEGSHDDQYSHGAPNVVFKDTKPVGISSHAHTRELPSSDEESDDENMEIARRHQAPEHHLGHQADEHRADKHHDSKKSKRRSERNKQIEVQFYDRHRDVLPPPLPQVSPQELSGAGSLLSRSFDGSWIASIYLNNDWNDVMIPQRVIQRDFGRSRIYEGKAVIVSCKLDNGKYVATRVSSK